MAKHAKSFSEVEQVSQTFKNQPVEIYIQGGSGGQQNQIYIGFNNHFYTGAVEYETFTNTKLMCLDIKLTAIGDLAPISATAVIRMVVDGNQYSINDPEYVHKRFIWDTEDCFEVPTNSVDFLRAGDIVKGNKGFLLSLGHRQGLELMLDLESCTVELKSPETLKGLKAYRHIKLWN
nr:MAG TPA: hypothetical protein [Caudoviricetes sp.]